MATPLRLPFRTKLFAALSLLVAAALTAALLVVRSETERRIGADFGLRFERTLAAFRQLQKLRRSVVRDEVNALAMGNPQFRTVLSSASVAEDDLGFGGGPSREEILRDANLRLRSLLPSLAIAGRHDVFAVASAAGQLVYTRTAPERFGDALAQVPPIDRAIAGEDTIALWGRSTDPARALPLAPGPGVYEVIAEPIAFGEELHGLVLVGTRVDRAMLDGLRAISGLHVVLLGETGALASTLDDARAAALVESLHAQPVAAHLAGSDAVEERRFADERWRVARAEIVPGAGTDPLALALLASIDEELAFLPELQLSFAALGAVIFALALAVAFALARGVARPVATLARAAERVGGGDLSTRVSITSGDELEELGGAFNHMVEGLRERDRIRHTFERHVSRDVAEELLRNPDVAAARGARRAVTVLFADLAGFTTLAEARAPEAVVTCLNEYFEVLCEAVLGTGGTVNDMLGDGVLASWGAPIAHPDHAARACRAALLASERLTALAATWRARGLPPLRWRIGIHTGEVVAGEMGTAERSKYGIIGDAVNLASRLEGANKALGTVTLVSEQTRAELGSALELQEIDTIRVAGRAAPLRAFELLGEKGRVAPERLAARDRYEEALAAYRGRDFARAAALLADFPPPCVLRERARRYATAPPPADWDGVFDAPKE
jgi:adenylate cyclase